MKVKKTVTLNEEEITDAIKDYLYRHGYELVDESKWLWKWHSPTGIPKKIEVEVV